MSITVSTDVFCDKCGNWSPEVTISGTKPAAKLARKRAKTLGWERRLFPETETFGDVGPCCLALEAENRDGRS